MAVVPVDGGDALPDPGYAPQHGPRSPGEVALEIALTTVWMVRTGRRLGDGPLLHFLAGEQLIEFWAG